MKHDRGEDTLYSEETPLKTLASVKTEVPRGGISLFDKFLSLVTMGGGGVDSFTDEYDKTLLNSFVIRGDHFAIERLLNAGANVNHVYKVRNVHLVFVT